MGQVLTNQNNYDYIGEDTIIKDYFENLPQKEIERMNFEDYLLESIKWDYDIIIITDEVWKEFKKSDDEYYEMKLEYSDGIKFYEKFKELTGIGLLEFDECFVSAKYIDEDTENSMNLIVNINGRSERFIIDCV